MAQFRTIMTALIVCALSVLPAASASAAMRMAAAMGTTPVANDAGKASAALHADCENHAGMVADRTGPSAVPAKSETGACPDRGCAKCSCLGVAVTGVLTMLPSTPSFAFVTVPATWATPGLVAPPNLPPSPPPRV